MIDSSIESMGGGRPKASTDTDQRVMTKGTGPLPPWPTRGDYSPDRTSLPLTKPSTLSRGTRPGGKAGWGAGKAVDEMTANPKQSEIRYTTYRFITPRSRP
jgi:hypothetical protein